MLRHPDRVVAALLFAAAVSAQPAEAQLGGLGRIRQRAEDAVRNRMNRPDTARTPAADQTGAAPAAGAAASPTTFVNFDFVPGERVLFAEDFTRDNPGDFPRRLEFMRGNGEVAEVNGRRVLRAPEELEFAIPLPEVLPERFTVEVELQAVKDARADLYFTPEGSAAFGTSNGGVRARVTRNADGSGTAGLEITGGRTAEMELRGGLNGFVPVRLMVDGPYTKMYVGGTRVANAPNIRLARANKVVVHLPAEIASDNTIYIASIRVAAGGRDLYDALSSTGRVAVQGILFDTGSDRIRPESAPTLQKIGDMLRGHADLRLKVEGHTDDVGADAANLDLSTRRAAAVRQYLVERFGIAAARLESQGLGEAKPAAPNTTPEGRQQNRRVELVRL